MRCSRHKLAAAAFVALAMVYIAASGSAALAADAGDGAAAASTALTPMQQVLALYSRGQWQQAADGAKALALDSNAADPRAWIIAGASDAQLGQMDAAVQAYQAYLGVCQDASIKTYVQAEIARCRAMPSPAGLISTPSASLSQQQLDELGAVEPGLAVQSSEHFQAIAPNAALANLLVNLAEQAAKRVMASFPQDVQCPAAVQIQVFRTQQEYAAQVKGAESWSGGEFQYSVDSQGLAHRTIYLVQLDSAGKFNTPTLDRVLPHELCHLLLTEWFGSQAAPLYLQEGLALGSEFASQDDRTILAASSMASGQGISIESLTTCQQYDSNCVDTFYARSYSLVSYLRERLTAAQFRQVLAQMRCGCTLDEALQRALAIPPADDFMEQLVGAWQDRATAHAQFLIALRGLANNTTSAAQSAVVAQNPAQRLRSNR